MFRNHSDTSNVLLCKFNCFRAHCKKIRKKINKIPSIINKKWGYSDERPHFCKVKLSK